MSPTVTGQASPSGKILFAADAVYAKWSPQRCNAHVVQKKLEALAAIPRKPTAEYVSAWAELERELE